MIKSNTVQNLSVAWDELFVLIFERSEEKQKFLIELLCTEHFDDGRQQELLVGTQ